MVKKYRSVKDRGYRSGLSKTGKGKSVIDRGYRAGLKRAAKKRKK